MSNRDDSNVQTGYGYRIFCSRLLKVLCFSTLTKFSDYHWQDNARSGYMFIYGSSSPVWPDWSDSNFCGIFSCGCNAFRTGNYWSYAEFVGSRLTQ